MPVRPLKPPDVSRGFGRYSVGEGASSGTFSRRRSYSPAVYASRVGRVQHAHEALREHADQARRQQERLDTHVAQARDGADGRVRVQRRHHEVAGQRRLHGDLRGLEVADFADHHHVRVLAQDGAQSARERHLDARVDLRLADAVDVVLDRVLDRHDVARAVVDAIERGIQRRGLARAGRTGDEQDAVRLVDQLVDVVAA